MKRWRILTICSGRKSPVTESRLPAGSMESRSKSRIPMVLWQTAPMSILAPSIRFVASCFTRNAVISASFLLLPASSDFEEVLGMDISDVGAFVLRFREG